MALGVGTRSEVFRRKWCQVWGLSMQEEIMLGIGTKSVSGLSQLEKMVLGVGTKSEVGNGAMCRD